MLVRLDGLLEETNVNVLESLCSQPADLRFGQGVDSFRSGRPGNHQLLVESICSKVSFATSQPQQQTTSLDYGI